MASKGKKVKHNRTAKQGKNEGSWELALERAKSALYKNKSQRTRLTAAIRFFQEKIRNGEPWPTEQVAD